MTFKTILTHAEKSEIIDDFIDWSGGFTPDECPSHGFDEATHESFIENGMNSKFSSKLEAIEDFLGDYEA